MYLFNHLAAVLGLTGGAPGSALDFRAVQADIGQFAVVEAREFANAAAVTLPFLDEADEGGKHGHLFLAIRFFDPGCCPIDLP